MLTIRQQFKAAIADLNAFNTDQTIIGYKTITIHYHHYYGNHHAGHDTGDDLMKIAQTAVYMDIGTITSEAGNGFTRRMTVRLTLDQFEAAIAMSKTL